MHQYKIEGFVKDENQELKLAATRYADSFEQAKTIRTEMDSLRDEEGKAYYAQLRLSVGVYKLVSYSDFLALYSV